MTDGINRVIDQTIIEAPTSQTVLERQFARNSKGDTTPSVENAKKLIFKNTKSVLVTNFDRGQPNQDITVMGDGHTTAAHNTKIRRSGGEAGLLEADKVYRFTYFDGQWIEDAGGAGGENEAGANGLSAYEVAVENGFVGTEADWLASLVGPSGADGADGAPGVDGIDGVNGVDGTDGAPGTDGLSAYQVAVNDGFVGTEADWLASLVGAPGADGADGVDGTNGTPGSVWYNGSGAPAGGLGVDGDYYVDDDTGDVYQKVAGVWGIVANIKGADGAAGGGFSRVHETFTSSASIPTGDTETGFWTMSSGLSWVIFRINVDQPFRLRLYGNSAYRDNDLARPVGTDPGVPDSSGTVEDHGLMIELRFPTATNHSWPMSPPALLGTDSIPTDSKIYYSLQNLGAPGVLTVDIWHLPIG